MANINLGEDVLDYLKENHLSEEKAIKNRELAELFNLSSRELRDLITSLRQRGNPVCSSSYGYWYSTDPDDIRKTLSRIESQVKAMRVTIKGLQIALVEAGGTL